MAAFGPPTLSAQVAGKMLSVCERSMRSTRQILQPFTRMKIKAAFLCWLTAFIVVQAADEYKICVVCQGPMTKTVFLKTSPYLKGKQPICESCMTIEQECFTCGLPVKFKSLDLKDGRHLCERDTKAAVLSDELAKRMFSDVKRDLMAMFAGTGQMPDRNVEVALVDRVTMSSLHRVQRFPHVQHATVGLTRTAVNQAGEVKHEIFILSGLNPGRFMAVAAHEYTHTWLQENVPPGRVLDSDTVEGFCELVAYRLTEKRSDAIELGLILTNDYTRGQVHAFLAVDASRFYETAKWMKSGIDQKLDPATVERVFLVTKEPKTQAPGWAVGARPVAAGPQTIKLRSVSGTPRRRFALINDQTFAANDLGRVRLGTSNVTIRCLEVTDEAAVIQLVPTGEKRKLVLEDR